MEKPLDFQSSTNLSPQTADRLLHKGLAALQRGDYGGAVAWLTKIQTNRSASKLQRIKAQMGLIRAYSHLDQVQKAMELCQNLSTSNYPQIRQWATRNQKLLSAKLSTYKADLKTESNQDLSGFTPLAFDIIESKFSGVDDIDVNAPESVTKTSISANDLSTDGTQNSLFHYRQLNQGAGQSESVHPKPVRKNFKAVIGIKDQPSAISKSGYQLDQLRLWGAQILTALAFYWLVNWLVHSTMHLMNWGLARLEWIRWPIRIFPLQILADDHSRLVLVTLLGLGLGSPWILDLLLNWRHSQGTLATRTLQANTPEGLALLRRVCVQKGWQLPELRLIPDKVPLCFSYGWLPRNTRIVLSEGFLEQFTAEEIASFLGYEMSHGIHRDLPVISGIATVLLIIHEVYWWLSNLGNRQGNALARTVLGILASLAYGVFWLLRKCVLWLSRERSRCCDRSTTSLTRQPLTHQHCLIKLTCSIAASLARRESTPPLLESLDYLMPLSYRLALSPGSSVHGIDQWQTLLSWDYQNPYRYWLVWNLPQLPTGERLSTLTQIAKEMGLPHQPFQTLAAKIKFRPRFKGQTYLPPLMLQLSPLLGMIGGLMLAMIFWFIGGISEAFDWFYLSWLYQDPSLLMGLTLIGFGIGTMLRINRCFPDIKTKSLSRSGDISASQRRPQDLPIDGRPVQLQGTLLGRSGVANLLCQDLFLRTPTGMINLNVMPALGPLGHLMHLQNHPAQITGTEVSVKGWLRRGPTIWLDVMNIQHRHKNFSISNPLYFSILISLGSCFLGIYVLFTGGR